MQDFCPLCMKNGIKRRIKAFQINLEEAVWACESEECMWPFGYEELKFFERKSMSCDWEDLSVAKENAPALMELSLYTPPMTPRGGIDIANTENLANLTKDKLHETFKNEFLSSAKEFRELIDSNKLPLLEPLELNSNNSIEESRNMKEENRSLNAFKMLPKITSIKKANIDPAIFSSISKHDNQKIQECKNSLTDATTITEIAKDFVILFNNTLDNEFDLNTQCKRNEQSKSDKVQNMDDIANDVETNFSIEMPSEIPKSEVDADVMILNTTNDSILNNSYSENSENLNIDMILENILADDKHINDKIDDNWLDLLMS